MPRKTVAVIGLSLLTGCGFLGFTFPFIRPPDPAPTGSAKLLPFASQQDLLDYFGGQVQSRNESGLLFEATGNAEDQNLGAPGGGDGAADDSIGAAPSPPTAQPTDGDGRDSGNSFSETTTQEAGVGEADVVKTDGASLYVITGERLRVVQVMPSTSQLALSPEVALEGYGRNIYLHDGKVIALTETYGGYFGGPIAVDVGVAVDPVSTDVIAAQDDGVKQDVGGTTDEVGSVDVSVSVPPEGQGDFAPQYERPKTIVTVVDVSSPGAAQVVSQTSFDGSLSASRMIDGVLHLVVSNYQNYYYDVFPLMGRADFSVAETTAQEVIPGFRRIDENGVETSGDVLTWQDMYRPEDPNGFGVVTVISFDVDNEGSFSAKGLVAEPGLIYSSTDALYLTDTNYNGSGGVRETTDIYKFAYADRGASPAATGTVPGRILNQYSMGEYNGFLRVATTVSPSFRFPFQEQASSNQVFVLNQDGDQLNVVGQLDDIAPRESIQSARFVGDKGYVVTFEQIDPLFTLDLSDPTNPQLVGKLEMPGFSTFLTPMDENHLLAVGQYVPPPGEFGPWGVQMSIFDVSDFGNPVRLHNLIIGEDSGAYSEAIYDPKAFTYFASEGLVALPVTVYNQRDFIDQPGGVAVGGGGFVGDGEGMDGALGTNDSVQSTPPSSGSAGAVDEPRPDVPPASDPSTGDDEAPPPDIIEDPFDFVPFEGLMVYRVSVDGGFQELGRIDTRFTDAFYSSFTRGVFIDQSIFAVTDNGVHGGKVADAVRSEVELPFPRNVNSGGGAVDVGILAPVAAER